MREVLHAAGSSLDDVVAVMVYLTSAADFQAMNQAYRAFWPGDPPTRTTVITALVVPDARDRDLDDRGAARRRARGRPAAGLEAVAQSLQLRHPQRRHAVPRRASWRDGEATTRSSPATCAPRRARSWRTPSELLEAAGLTFRDVVSARIYLTRAADFAAMNEVYREFFPDAPPARATVQSGLAGPEAVVEITFVASSAARQAIGAPPSGLPLSPAIRAGRHLYVSGMLGNTPDDRGRRRGTDPRDAGEDRPTLARRRRVTRRRRRGARLPHRCRGVRHHERRISRVLRRRISRRAPPW